MTKKEAAVILAILKAAYPNSYKNMTQEDAMGTITVWAVQFADIPADIVLMAVHKAISTSAFVPAISEVKTKIAQLHWEANDILHCNRRIADTISKEKKEAAERICAATEKYGYSRSLEPSLESMLMSADKILIEHGTSKGEYE